MRNRAEFRKFMQGLSVDDLIHVGTDLGHKGPKLETFMNSAKRLMAQAWTEVLVGYAKRNGHPHGSIPMTDLTSLPSNADLTEDVSSIAVGPYEGMNWEEILFQMFEFKHLDILEDHIGDVWASTMEALINTASQDDDMVKQFAESDGWILFSEFGTDYGIRLLENMHEIFFWRETPPPKILTP